MKLSIFPHCKTHPTKDEKRSEAFKFSAPYLPTVVTISNDEDLIKYICNYAWSPAVFNGVRKAENFVSCDFLVYDIDEGLKIDEAANILDNTPYCYLILPSPSHTETSHRFRIILPLAHSILDLETFASTWKNGSKLFSSVDEQCSDSCRAYFGSRDNDGFADFSKDFFTPIKKLVPEKSGFVPSQTTMLKVTADTEALVTQIYGEKRDKVPKAVDYFIRNAKTGLPGSWVNSLNAFCFSLSLSGVDEEMIMEVCELLAPDELDRRDLYQIKKSIADGQRMKD